MERDFWTLIAEQRAEPRPAEAAVEHPYFEMSHEHAYESVLPVFSSEEKALAFAQHIGEQHGGQVPTPIRHSQWEIQERAFRGNPQGHCVIDPTPDHPGREITVSDLHIG
jgi:hypothetical protein